MSGSWQDTSKLIWIDLEMTGLDTVNDHIIEVAAVVTNSQLNIIAQGPDIVIHQPQEVLDKMDQWNTQQHTKTGLVDKVLSSNLTLQDAEKMMLEFLSQHLEPKQSPMCGNSICQDRRFMARLMPELESFFHYRHIDVSTIKELVRRWYPDTHQGAQKDSNHRALDDVIESIEELRFYREHFFRII